MISLSIIIVNYNTFDLTCECIESVLQFTVGIEYEIILVDNASVDMNPDSFLAKFPSLILIKNKYNEGFGRANNSGIKKAKGKFLLFLNSDTQITDNSITACYNRIAQDETSVAAGVQLLNVDGSKQDSAYDKFYWIHLTDGIPYIGKLIKYPFSALKRILYKSSDSEIGYLNGAFLMVKRKALDRSRPFDEDFFLYAEETELCTRLRKLGDLKYYDDLSVYHLINGSKTNDTFHYGQHQLSIQLFIRKKFGVILYLAVFLFHGMSLFLNFFISITKSILYFNPSPLNKFKVYFRTFLVWTRLAPKIILRTPHLFKFNLKP